MAAPSVYREGTATVAANSMAVTGQGTSWLNTILPGDFFGTHKGSPNRVSTVNSNTSLTLAYPWLGGAQAAAPYEIMYQSDSARMAEAARQLIEKLSSGNVDAFAELVGAADRIPVFAGPGAMSLLPAGTRGKVILAAADTPAVLTALGPVFGGAMPNPAGAGVGLSNGDFDTVTVTGLYTIAGTWSNGPNGTAGHSGVLEVYNRGAGLCTQVYRSVNGGVYKRHTATPETGTWPNAWASAENVTVGNVLNSGGYPIGAIIERGSNANGEYVRYADGTQMCWSGAGGAGMSGATDIAVSTIFVGPTSTWTFPVAFSAVGTTVGHCTNTRSGARWGAVLSVSATSMTSRVYSYQTSASSLAYDCFAIGRWFN